MKPTVIVVFALLAVRPVRADEGALYATFQTSKGSIVMKLLPEDAPKTVKNFVQLAQGQKTWTDPRDGKTLHRPLFDGTLFHRASPGFLIEGGDPFTRNSPLGQVSDAHGAGGPGYSLEDEIPRAGRLFDQACALAMAKSDGETNGSQFIITDGNEGQVKQLEPRPCDSKPGLCGFTRFGEGVCGCELVRKIARAGSSNTRLKKVVISTKAPACVQAQARAEKPGLQAVALQR